MGYVSMLWLRQRTRDCVFPRTATWHGLSLTQTRSPVSQADVAENLTSSHGIFIDSLDCQRVSQADTSSKLRKADHDILARRNGLALLFGWKESVMHHGCG